jgi:Holliday junction DNA helicase RuvA
VISALRGKVEEVDGARVTLDVQGVGYEIFCTSMALAELLSESGERRVLVHTDVKEDSIRLFAFAERLEREVFRLLISISGIGARTALDILSSTDARSLLRTIAGGEAPQLQKIKGIGKKTAERIIVELRDKVSSVIDGRMDEKGVPSYVSPRRMTAETLRKDFGDGEGFGEAEEALCVLGFRREEAEKALTELKRTQVDKVAELQKDPAAILKLALQYI